MGMPITVDVRDAGADAAALDVVYSDLRFIDGLFSPFKEDSVVSDINAGRPARDALEPLVREVLELCSSYETETRGYFSAWRKGRLDPSGLVKGWALARAAAFLDAHGYRDYFIDGAGDVFARGRPSADERWRVGIRHPVERDKVARVVLATDLAVATSGTYEKGAHIYDPLSGEPVSAWLSMTILGPGILEADVFATAAFAMGPAGIEFIEARDGYEAYAIDPQLQAHRTSGFDGHCDPEVV
jgi:thiamine biosynthesis lipoprotein